MVSCVYHRSIIKDEEVLDGWLGLYPLGQHARVTLPVDLTGPKHTTYQRSISWANLLAPGTMLAKTAHETSLDLDSCFDHHWVSSAGLRQPHQ